jgi:hypothetical protein
MNTCKTKINQQCLLVDIPYDVVASNNVSNNMINGISVVQNGPFTHPFQVAYNIFPGGGASQLQYWDNSSSTFVNFGPGQYSNVNLQILADNDNCQYVVMLCPRNQNISMVVGNQTIEPYYQYYDVLYSSPTGDLSLVPDSCFTPPANLGCSGSACISIANCTM